MNTFDPNYKPIMISFRVAQKVVIFNSENKILFLRRSSMTKRAGGWDFPGGALENEEPDEGIIRETREEANIEIIKLQPIGFATYNRKEPKMRTLMIGYMADLKSGEVKLSWEHDEYRWFSINDAQKNDLPKDLKKFLKTSIKLRE
ncbi:NUDIX hydrolase [Candidatus Curtissbacteria bacterium]|nr:NUDIX hydrolase [Candidatus Curtissbacteria bacterium]